MPGLPGWSLTSPQSLSCLSCAKIWVISSWLCKLISCFCSFVLCCCCSSICWRWATMLAFCPSICCWNHVFYSSKMAFMACSMAVKFLVWANFLLIATELVGRMALIPLLQSKELTREEEEGGARWSPIIVFYAKWSSEVFARNDWRREERWEKEREREVDNNLLIAFIHHGQEQIHYSIANNPRFPRHFLTNCQLITPLTTLFILLRKR